MSKDQDDYQEAVERWRKEKLLSRVPTGDELVLWAFRKLRHLEGSEAPGGYWTCLNKNCVVRVLRKGDLCTSCFHNRETRGHWLCATSGCQSYVAERGDLCFEHAPKPAVRYHCAEPGCTVEIQDPGLCDAHRYHKPGSRGSGRIKHCGYQGCTIPVSFEHLFCLKHKEMNNRAR